MKQTTNTTGYPVVGEILESIAPRDTDDGLEMHDNSCGECGHPYKQGDETHYPECSRLQGNQQPETRERRWYEAKTGNGQRLIIDEETGRNVAVVYDKADAPVIVTAVNNHAALVAVLREELEAIRVWQSARGIPADVRDGLQISTAKIQTVLARVRES